MMNHRRDAVGFGSMVVRTVDRTANYGHSHPVTEVDMEGHGSLRDPDGRLTEVGQLAEA